jgi:hypothetical protein
LRNEALQALGALGPLAILVLLLYLFSSFLKMKIIISKGPNASKPQSRRKPKGPKGPKGLIYQSLREME